MVLKLPHPGSLVAFAIVSLVAGGFVALATVDGGTPALLSIGPYLGRVLAFSVVQALLSTALSLVLGIGLALALARRRFPGRNLVLAVLSTTMVLPTIVAVFAVFAVYGRSGWLAEGLALLGWKSGFSIFGYPGILIAHVFLNGPFVARIALDGLNQVPAEHWRLAGALGFTPAQVFRHLDWPVLRAELPGIAGLIFLMCFKSFAIVLALGGGPSRSTLEVAIYEALKIDLDFGRVAWLALIQLAICLSMTGLLHWAFTRPPVGHTIRSLVRRPDAKNRRLKILDVFVLVVSALFIGPLAFSVLTGFRSLAAVIDADLLRAFVTSLTIASCAAILACLLAYALASAARRQRIVLRSPRIAAFYDLLPDTMLAVPPFALTAGLFLLIRRFGDPSTAGFILLPLINGLAAVPFAYRYVAPHLLTTEERYGRVAASLGLTGWSKLTIMDWPALKRPLAAGFALAMALSFGDFGIVALFGGTELVTLPYLLYERLGAYRLDEASSIGLVIVLLAVLLAHVSGRLSHAGD
ncbi:ABC transporter permease subunit [Microvirga lotononidis]|uniref:ABC-type Fe3+ transport system, permease component n=1 Tax=Microvirga lotononidis TaxID=864069 RepID=I4YM06_9HYPH|nr:ABC transporter permease subunit [Microvirga lotononidis]EIM24998.1 ABC-type Fe3+ transport system, permease component [Microvirga lotononidis]WQO29508.1 ABC transporter permease subunit [Microvirga lotononidis]